MKRPRPSLLRRLTFGFILGHALGLVIFFLAVFPFAREDEEDQVGPDVAISMLREDLVERDGRLDLRPDADVAEFAQRSPGAWFIAKSGDRTLAHGPVPESARRVLAAIGPTVKSAEFGNLGAPGRPGDASFVVADSAAGQVLLAAGGIRAESVTLATWIGYLHREAYAYLPLASALFTLLGALIAIPLILRSMRPTLRAAATLDPSDLEKRLPEEGVVKELLPLVRAFNAALGRLEEGFERRRRFIADVAHELRTPVAVLNMHVETLPEGSPKPDLQRTVYRLGQMVGQMLDAERLALSRRERQRVDLVELGRSAVADVAPLAVANGYEIGFSAAADCVAVEGDPHAISRAMANLLGNAIAHGGGAGTIELRVGQEGRVDVSDQGPGIAVEARERIFEPFRRERWDRDGCGLGLHLVREIMHAHGGEVRLVGSAPGAIFRLDFAAGRAAA